MSEIIFTIAGKPEALHTDSQKSWMQALEDNGIFLDAPCGGHGSCGKCRILVNGKEVYQGKYYMDGKYLQKAAPRTRRYEKPQETKIVESIAAALKYQSENTPTDHPASIGE